MQCYKSFGNAYRELQGWSAFVITSANGFEKQFGIKADRERKLYNSNRECRYYYYYGERR
jgi:putative N6-adenine-specific DNA methylase